VEQLAIFAYLDEKSLQPINAFLDSAIGGLSTYLSAPLAVGISIYIILNGITFTKGLTNETVSGFVIKAIKLAIIFTLATKAAEYNYYVKSVFFDYLPNEVGSAIANASSGSSFDAQKAKVGAGALDSLLRKGLDTGTAMWEKGPNGFTIVLYALFFLLIVVATFMMCVFGYVVLFYAKCALAIIIAVGPLFIAFALFQPTRRFTEAWIGQALNFSLLQILIITIGALLVNAAASLAIDSTDLVRATIAVLQFSVIAICAWYIFLQLPSISSGLAAGGASLAFGRNTYPGAAMSAAYQAVRGKVGQKKDAPPSTASTDSSKTSGNPISGFADGTLNKGKETPFPTIDPIPAPPTPKPGEA
jgi:type IV secretion system protein VirB6